MDAPPVPLLTPGAALRYAMADFDVSDTYVFKLRDAGDGLTFAYAFAGDDPSDSVQFSPDALATARTIAVLSQGGWLDSRLTSPPVADDVTRFAGDLPPFLLSRAGLQELRAGQTRLRPEWAGPRAAPTLLTLRERITATIDAEGEALEVPVLVAEGEGVALQVIDDERWPLIVERVEDDNFWRLVALDRNDGVVFTDDDDSSPRPPPEPAGPLAPTGPIGADALAALAERLGVADLDMDFEGTRFSLVDDAGRAVIEADYRVVLVALPGGVLRRAHTFVTYAADQVLGPLGDDDPDERPGDLDSGAAIADALARRAGADALYPDPLGSIYVALFDLRALA